jgi:hypothetical protein
MKGIKFMADFAIFVVDFVVFTEIRLEYQCVILS